MKIARFRQDGFHELVGRYDFRNEDQRFQRLRERYGPLDETFMPTAIQRRGHRFFVAEFTQRSDGLWVPFEVERLRLGRFWAAASPYVAAGYNVVPTSAFSDGKKPAVMFGDTTDREVNGHAPWHTENPEGIALARYAAWTRDHAESNALLLVDSGFDYGPPPLVVIDIDSDSWELQEWVIEQFGDTPLIHTSGRGPHLFYRKPRGVHVKSGAKCLGPDSARDENGAVPIDIKAHGSYVVAPGSLHRKRNQEYASKIDPGILTTEWIERHVPELDVDKLKHLKEVYKRGAKARGGSRAVAKRTTTPVSIKQIKKVVARLAKSERTAHVAVVLEAVLAGDVFAKEGERDEVLKEVAWRLAMAFPDADPPSLAEFFGPSLRKMRRVQTDTTGRLNEDAVADKIRRAQEKIRADRERQREEAQAERKAMIGEAFRQAEVFDEDGNPRSTSYTAEEIAAWAHAAGITVDLFHRTRWVLQHGRSFYIRVLDYYMGPFGADEFFAAAKVLLAPAGIPVERMGREGPVPLSNREIVRACGKRVAVEIRYGVAHSYLDEDRGVLVESCCPLRDIKPRRSKVVAEWLKVLPLNRDDLSRLLDWLATATKLEYPSAALYMCGPPRCGKNLLAESMPRLFLPGTAPARMHKVFQRFNDTLLRSPIVHADEKIPTDRHGKQMTEELRTLIQAHTHAVERKNLPVVDLIGSVRCVVSANNEGLFDNEGELGIDDIDALAERIFFLECSERATEYLDKLGADRVARFVDANELAAHLLYLRDKRCVKRAGRLMVEGNIQIVRDRMLLGQKNTGSLLHWLTFFLQNARSIVSGVSTDAAFTAPLPQVTSAGLLITSRFVHEAWDRFFSPPARKPTIRDIGKALKALAPGGKRQKLSGANRTQAYVVGIRYLYLWAEREGYSTKKQMKIAIKSAGSILKAG